MSDEEQVILDRYYDDIISKMSNVELINFKDYTNPLYDNNNFLFKYMAFNKVNYDKDRMNIVIEMMNNRIRLCRLPIPLTVYRGTSHIEFNSSVITDNNHSYFINKSFLSTTLNYDVAESFCTHSNIGLIMSIFLPKGYPALYLEHISSCPGEQEVLLPSNQLFVKKSSKEIESNEYSYTLEFYKSFNR